MATPLTSMQSPQAERSSMTFKLPPLKLGSPTSTRKRARSVSLPLHAKSPSSHQSKHVSTPQDTKSTSFHKSYHYPSQPRVIQMSANTSSQQRSEVVTRKKSSLSTRLIALGRSISGHVPQTPNCANLKNISDVVVPAPPGSPSSSPVQEVASLRPQSKEYGSPTTNKKKLKKVSPRRKTSSLVKRSLQYDDEEIDVPSSNLQHVYRVEIQPESPLTPPSPRQQVVIHQDEDSDEPSWLPKRTSPNTPRVTKTILSARNCKNTDSLQVNSGFLSSINFNLSPKQHHDHVKVPGIQVEMPSPPPSAFKTHFSEQ